MHWVLVFGHLDYPNGTRNLDPASQEGSGSIEYYKHYPNGTRNLDSASQEGSGSIEYYKRSLALQ
eukprot:scaffold10301_cov366-Chaetoceros_neogracile.AAC.1